MRLFFLALSMRVATACSSAATVAGAEGMSFGYTVPDETGTPQDDLVANLRLPAPEG